MKNTALALLSVGLCFYNAYLYKIRHETDDIAALVSIIAAIAVFIF